MGRTRSFVRPSANVDPGLSRLKQPGSQLVLEYLSHRVPGQLSDDFEPLRNLLVGQPFFAAVMGEILQGELLDSLGKDNHGATALPGARIGEPNYSHVDNRWVLVQHVLN